MWRRRFLSTWSAQRSTAALTVQPSIRCREMKFNKTEGRRRQHTVALSGICTANSSFRLISLPDDLCELPHWFQCPKHRARCSREFTRRLFPSGQLHFPCMSRCNTDFSQSNDEKHWRRCRVIKRMKYRNEGGSAKTGKRERVECFHQVRSRVLRSQVAPLNVLIKWTTRGGMFCTTLDNHVERMA